MSEKTIEEKFEDYWLSTFGTMSSEDYIKYKDVGKCSTKQGFQAGYSLAQKELEEQLKECEDILIRVLFELGRVHDLEGETRFEEWFIGKARRYLEKWK